MKKFFPIAVVLLLNIVVFSGCSKKEAEKPLGYEGLSDEAQKSEKMPASGMLLPSKQKTRVPASEARLAGESEIKEEPAGEFVKPSNEDIQAALKNAGCYAGAIDGKIGPVSKQAIRDFQEKSGLQVDGNVGKKTWAVLKQHLAVDTQEKSRY